jgi:hypothetical protein
MGRHHAPDPPIGASAWFSSLIAWHSLCGIRYVFRRAAFPSPHTDGSASRLQPLFYCRPVEFFAVD